LLAAVIRARRSFAHGRRRNLASRCTRDALAAYAVVDDSVVVAVNEVVNDRRLIVYHARPIASDHVQTDRTIAEPGRWHEVV
jgi:hypothetical protein